MLYSKVDYHLLQTTLSHSTQTSKVSQTISRPWLRCFQRLKNIIPLGGSWLMTNGRDWTDDDDDWDVEVGDWKWIEEAGSSDES